MGTLMSTGRKKEKKEKEKFVKGGLELISFVKMEVPIKPFWNWFQDVPSEKGDGLDASHL